MLNPKKLGLAGGIIWGVSLFVMTIVSVYTGYGTQFLTLMMDIYPGYSVSMFGSVIGFIYGFIDMGVFMFLLAWVYNKINV